MEPYQATKVRFVDYLPDLIQEEDYLDESSQHKIRVRISLIDEDLEILGDSMHARALEELLTNLGASEIERMLCG